MHYFLWFIGGLAIWLTVGFIWNKLFDNEEEEEEHQECPYE